MFFFQRQKSFIRIGIMVADMHKKDEKKTGIELLAMRYHIPIVVNGWTGRKVMVTFIYISFAEKLEFSSKGHVGCTNILIFLV